MIWWRLSGLGFEVKRGRWAVKDVLIENTLSSDRIESKTGPGNFRSRVLALQVNVTFWKNRKTMTYIDATFGGVGSIITVHRKACNSL